MFRNGSDRILGWNNGADRISRIGLESGSERNGYSSIGFILGSDRNGSDYRSGTRSGTSLSRDRIGPDFEDRFLSRTGSERIAFLSGPDRNGFCESLSIEHRIGMARNETFL